MASDGSRSGCRSTMEQEAREPSAGTGRRPAAALTKQETNQDNPLELEAEHFRVKHAWRLKVGEKIQVSADSLSHFLIDQYYILKLKNAASWVIADLCVTLPLWYTIATGTQMTL